MELTPRPEQSQMLVLTQAMRQSMQCLQMSSSDLTILVQDASLSNPLLNVQLPTYYEAVSSDEWAQREAMHTVPVKAANDWADLPTPQENTSLEASFSKAPTFLDFLNEQIGQIRLLDRETLPLCRYLIGCLDHRGYLDCSLDELAEETSRSLFELEQALFAVQMLEPAGVGARSLSECLILQLARGKAFNRLTISIARDGLEPLSRRDYGALATMLHVSVKEAKRAADEILALNPIPSRGFPGSETPSFIVPDATFSTAHGHVSVDLNEAILPRLSINEEYLTLLKSTDDPSLAQYLHEKHAEATELLHSVHLRSNTLLRVLLLLSELQCGYFLGGELLPMTMRQVAEKLELSNSTVSRAVQNKYIAFNGQTIPLRSLFSAAVVPDRNSISRQAVKQRILHLIRTESTASPLTDETLCAALEVQGITVSRRTVAKYRTELGIASASRRKKS